MTGLGTDEKKFWGITVPIFLGENGTEKLQKVKKYWNETFGLENLTGENSTPDDDTNSLVAYIDSEFEGDELDAASLLFDVTPTTITEDITEIVSAAAPYVAAYHTGGVGKVIALAIANASSEVPAEEKSSTKNISNLELLLTTLKVFVNILEDESIDMTGSSVDHISFTTWSSVSSSLFILRLFWRDDLLPTNPSSQHGCMVFRRSESIIPFN